MKPTRTTLYRFVGDTDDVHVELSLDTFGTISFVPQTATVQMTVGTTPTTVSDGVSSGLPDGRFSFPGTDFATMVSGIFPFQVRVSIATESFVIGEGDMVVASRIV